MPTLFAAVFPSNFDDLCSRVASALSVPPVRLNAAQPHSRIRFETARGRLDGVCAPALRCLLLQDPVRGDEGFLLPAGAGVLALGVRAATEDGPLACLEPLAGAGSGFIRDTDADPGWPSVEELTLLLLQHERSAVAEVLDPLETAESLAAPLNAALAERDDEIRALRWRLRQLEAQAPAPDVPLPESANRYPSSLAALHDWSQQFSEQLVVLPRALKGARKSHYEEPGRVYRALHYLARDYWRHKCGELSLADNEQALVQAGVTLSGSTTPSVAGMQGEQYFVNYRGERLFLDQHLVRGGGTDPRYCMRVYFTWHAATRKVVVGWLPSHLSNTLS